MLSETVRKYPDNIAFKDECSSLSYAGLNQAAAKVANYFTTLGVKRGDRVLLLLPNGTDYAICYYGSLKAGATVVPVNKMYKTDEIKYTANDSTAGLIITDLDSYPKIKEIKKATGIKTILLAGRKMIEDTPMLKDVLKEYSPIMPPLHLDPFEDIAAIQYTGGTTGPPKGVMLTHYNLVANAIQNATWFGWSHKDIVIGVLPFYHSWGACSGINSPVYCGAKVIIMSRYNSRELLGTIEREKATVMYGAASMFIMLANSLEMSDYDLSSLRYVKAGAMPIPPEVMTRWENLTKVKMVLGYGLSEASPETHNSPPDRIRAGTVGIPIIDTDARIVDEEKGVKELPIGMTGELVIRGPQVMKGYLHRPEENREALRDGWLHTGDLGFLDQDGYFHITDRKKEIIKYKGYTIAPAEVEAVLYEHPGVVECAVIGKPDALAGEIPKAFVVRRKGSQVTSEELIGFCEQSLSSYKKIREVEFIDEIPKTPVGKVLRRVLKERERRKLGEGNCLE